MKAIMVMFDSLNRHFLPPYGCDWVHAPNFRRLAGQSVVFDTSYVGSMPCMPARRELHTGRLNFLHRSWGPLEPFDDSMPRILGEAGIRTHLVSDHYHYWEDGGATYHTKYGAWECIRGQEGDPCLTDLNEPDIPEPNPGMRGARGRQDRVNRSHMREESEMPQAMTFERGLEFLRLNHAHDGWFLQLETFDPHEPYAVPRRFLDLYPQHDFDALPYDWPEYEPGSDLNRRCERHFRFLNAALVSMCDAYLGRVLDFMDRHALWKDTMLIVNTDHGFLLGEHELWAKCRVPFFNEVARTPLFIWDPRCGCAGERRSSLVQTIDLPATLLDFFRLDLPPDMEGVPLRDTMERDAPVREAGLFGLHGGHVNVTDGRYVYMRAPARPDNLPLANYTLMPTHMRGPFTPEEMRRMERHPGFRFTQGCPVMRIPAGPVAKDLHSSAHDFGTLLFDNETDPGQQAPIRDARIEERMRGLLARAMRANDAPPEQFERLALSDT